MCLLAQLRCLLSLGAAHQWLKRLKSNLLNHSQKSHKISYLKKDDAHMPHMIPSNFIEILQLSVLVILTLTTVSELIAVIASRGHGILNMGCNSRLFLWPCIGRAIGFIR